MKINLRKLNGWNAHQILAVTGISGIIGLFLPFSWSTSPLEALIGDAWQIASPAFLSVFITFATIRFVISGSLFKVEKLIAYIVGLMAAGVTLSVIFSGNMWPTNFQELLAYVIPIVMLLLGAYLVLGKSKKGLSKEHNPLIAMQMTYLANCLMCLIAFWPPKVGEWGLGGWQIGAYFCLVASVVYLIQIALFLLQRNEISEHA